MNISKWAEKEIEIVLAAHDENEDFFGYYKACLESALKALNALLEDEHSGMSICVTKDILNRLIDGKPLSPIEDTEGAWVEVDFGTANKRYRCKRMGSLRKNVYPSGKVEYRDNSRVRCVNIVNGAVYTSGLITRLIDEMYPITMPYMPTNNPYIVYCRDFLLDENNGDFDTVHVRHLETPSGERVEINRVFTQGSEDRWIEITPEELEKRLAKYAVPQER